MIFVSRLWYRLPLSSALELEGFCVRCVWIDVVIVIDVVVVIAIVIVIVVVILTVFL